MPCRSYIELELSKRMKMKISSNCGKFLETPSQTQWKIWNILRKAVCFVVCEWKLSSFLSNGYLHASINPNSWCIFSDENSSFQESLVYSNEELGEGNQLARKDLIDMTKTCGQIWFSKQKELSKKCITIYKKCLNGSFTIFHFTRRSSLKKNTWDVIFS